MKTNDKIKKKGEKKMRLSEYGGRIISTDGRRTVEIIDPNDRRLFQYRAAIEGGEGGIERRVLRPSGKTFVDTKWEPVDMRAMLRVRGKYHPIIDELGRI